MLDHLTDLELSQLVFHVTGHVYAFAEAEGRYLGSEDKFTRVGITYQLMPESIPGMDFFDWYCSERPYHQFFNTKQDCVLNFLKYYFIWKELWITPNN